MEEVEGFEPPRGVTRLSVFKTDPFSRTWVYLQHIKEKWCRGPESNRHGDHSPQDFKSCASASSATPAYLERKTRFELATPTLARWCSTTELLPQNA